MAAINHPLGQRRTLPFPAPFGPVNWWVVSAIVIFGIGAMLPVLQNSTATNYGFDAQRVQAEQARLNGEIRLLEADVAQLSSIERVRRRAEAIGLIPGDRPIHIRVDAPGPAPAKLPAEYLPTSVREANPPVAWWRSLLSWMSLTR